MKTFNLAYPVLTPRGAIGPGIVSVDDERAELLLIRGFTPEGKAPQSADPAKIKAPGSAPGKDFEPTRGSAPKSKAPTAEKPAQAELPPKETPEEDEEAGDERSEAGNGNSEEAPETEETAEVEEVAEETPTQTALPADFPSKKELEAAGYTTVESVRDIEDLTQVRGIKEQRADAILLALEAL